MEASGTVLLNGLNGFAAYPECLIFISPGVTQGDVNGDTQATVSGVLGGTLVLPRHVTKQNLTNTNQVAVESAEANENRMQDQKSNCLVDFMNSLDQPCYKAVYLLELVGKRGMTAALKRWTDIDHVEDLECSSRHKTESLPDGTK